MTGSAALLIDLENFYLGRETNYVRSHPDELYDFPIDLDSLCNFAADMAGQRRLVVRRAYANFNDRRPGSGDRQWDYYLQPLPRFLMEQGVEPVQVFRFPGGGNKNAADMRLALDATALRLGPTQGTVDLFIIVTGDADFVPLVLELKRTGAEVAIIGVEGSTNPIFQRYADRFEYFGELLAARDLRREDQYELQPVRAALQRLLERNSPINFAAVKPLLSAELATPFNPLRFDCESTGDFLRKHAAGLGIVTRRGEHDWEVRLRVEGDPVETVAAPAGGTGESGAAGEPHSSGLYRDLLRQGIPRCYVVDHDDWIVITDSVFRRVGGAARPAVLHQDLVDDITDDCVLTGMTDAVRKVRDVAFQLFKAGCFHCADDGPAASRTDFHWSRPAVLAPDIASADDLRERCWAFLARLLRRRLEQRGTPSLQTGALAELLCGPEPTERDTAAIERAVRSAPADA
jgi:uncharacterized LabA/DUF88 family protein